MTGGECFLDGADHCGQRVAERSAGGDHFEDVMLGRSQSALDDLRRDVLDRQPDRAAREGKPFDSRAPAWDDEDLRSAPRSLRAPASRERRERAATRPLRRRRKARSRGMACGGRATNPCRRSASDAGLKARRRIESPSCPSSTDQDTEADLDVARDVGIETNLLPALALFGHGPGKSRSAPSPGRRRLGAPRRSCRARARIRRGARSALATESVRRARGRRRLLAVSSDGRSRVHATRRSRA